MRGIGLKFDPIPINDHRVPRLQKEMTSNNYKLLDHMMSHQGTVPDNMVITTTIKTPTPSNHSAPTHNDDMISLLKYPFSVEVYTSSLHLLSQSTVVSGRVADKRVMCNLP